MAIKYKLLELNKTNAKELSIAIGNFNGFHLGHQTLLKRTKEIAKVTNTASAIMTFEKEQPTNQIMDIDDKKNFLAKMGFNYLIVIVFDEQFKNLSKEEFIAFLQQLSIKNVIVGEDFRFGYQRSGSIIDLKDSSINTTVVNLLSYQDKKISSHIIVELLKDGRIKEANELLGYHYTIKNHVQKGFQNGHLISFPTANLTFNNYVLVKSGVYATLVHYQNKTYLGMAHVGVHATIDELKTPILEVNILDFNQDIYEQKIAVEFLDYITDVHKFTSIDELKSHLQAYEKIIRQNYNIQMTKCVSL